MPQKTSQIFNNSQLPPQNIEAEKSTLGAILLDKEALNQVVDFLRPEDFYNRAHQLIFGGMAALFEKREPIDLLSLSNKLDEMGQLEAIGGTGYLTSLINTVPSSSHILHYAKIVERKKILRDLIDSAHHIIGLSNQEEEEIDIILDQAEQKLFSISQKSTPSTFAHIGGPIIKEAFERIDRLHKGDGKLRGHSTGFYDLDGYLGGLQKSDLIVLAARPSLGKTSLALDIAKHVAQHEKVPVGIFSIEMAKEQIVDRLICAEANINLWKLRTGRLSSEGDGNDFEKVAVALDRLAQAPIFIDDVPSPTILQMRTMARRLQAEHGLGLLVVDYLQLIRPTRASDSEVQQVTEISRNLKALAKELNIPILAVSQLSRNSEMRTDQRPKLSDLRSSGSIEQDADVVLLIYREDKVKKDTEKKGIAEIMIEKHRNGPTGKVELFFDEESVSFKNLAKGI
ncbi:MAG: replicative DNA helicase [Parcubacteria group bacterium Gr01-1014_44]|nr:MAG: replicative DNA helicase [Parcubacteria group bacterium Gr01-1014_44]